MGIEPAGKALPELENKRFGAIANPKCDWRAIFLVMRGNVELRETTRGFAIEFPMSTLPASGHGPLLVKEKHGRFE
jgi:hypothetical protein